MKFTSGKWLHARTPNRPGIAYATFLTTPPEFDGTVPPLFSLFFYRRGRIISYHFILFITVCKLSFLRDDEVRLPLITSKEMTIKELAHCGIDFEESKIHE